MRAILIDPFTQTLTEHELLEEKPRDDIKRLLDCEYTDFVYVIPKHFLLVDEMGLHKPNKYFLLRGYGQPLAGKGLVIGKTPEFGDYASATLSLDAVKKNVMFLGPETIFKGLHSEEKKSGNKFIMSIIADFEGVPKWPEDNS